MTPSTALIICARAPRRVLPVPVVKKYVRHVPGERHIFKPVWECSWCGARVKVVA